MNGIATAVSTFRQIRARDGRGPALSALSLLAPTSPFLPFRDCEPAYDNGPAEFHAALFQAGLLGAKRTTLADTSLTAWVRRSR